MGWGGGGAAEGGGVSCESIKIRVTTSGAFYFLSQMSHVL